MPFDLKNICEKAKAIVSYDKLSAEDKQATTPPRWLSGEEIEFLQSNVDIEKREEFYTNCGLPKNTSLLTRLELINNLYKTLDIQKEENFFKQAYTQWLLELGNLVLQMIQEPNELDKLLGFNNAKTPDEISRILKQYRFYFHSDRYGQDGDIIIKEINLRAERAKQHFWKKTPNVAQQKSTASTANAFNAASNVATKLQEFLKANKFIEFGQCLERNSKKLADISFIEKFGLIQNTILYKNFICLNALLYREESQIY